MNIVRKSRFSVIGRPYAKSFGHNEHNDNGSNCHFDPPKAEGEIC